MEMQRGPIAVFDSGFGGLTILKEIVKAMPQYDYIYLGDNARTPYGTRSFETVYDFTLQAVKQMFKMGAPLVILACNTASAKALRSIQVRDLPNIDATRRVLGVIRPTVEAIGNLTKTGKVGVLGTTGTIQSQTYPLEVKKLFPEVEVFGQECPMFVPLVENSEYDKPGADYFVKKYIDALMSQSPDIDTVILGCTHYPILEDKIREALPKGVNLILQGELVAESLKDYLMRHPEMEQRCTKGGERIYLTTDSVEKFEKTAKIFMPDKVAANKITID
ncbi:MAG: glutamate racemase [Bacteroidales bacterium]|nr:glutamate racemase [Bacteroidales bacterium]